MRIHHRSTAPAKAAAKRLRGLLGRFHGPDLTLTGSRAAVASMLGYGSWSELAEATRRTDAPSPYDEAVPELVAERVAYQGRRLAEAIGFDPGKARIVAGALRTSAHPAGPHLDGRDPEFRGRTLEGEEMAFVRGRFRPFILRAAPLHAVPSTHPPARTPAPPAVLVRGRGERAIDLDTFDLRSLSAGDSIHVGRAPADPRVGPIGPGGWPSTRDGYLFWLTTRIDGYGNEMIEPIRSLLADGLVRIHPRSQSDAIHLTPAGRARAAGLGAQGAGARVGASASSIGPA